MGDVVVRRDVLRKAIQCITSLDTNNPMTEKCARYTSKLDRVLSALGKSPLPQHRGVRQNKAAQTPDSDVPLHAEPAGTDTASVDAGQAPHDGNGIESPVELPGLFDLGSTPSGLDLSEFMVPGDLDFLNAFDMNRAAF